MVAAAKGHLATTELLLDRGAQIEAQDDNGTNALMFAAVKNRVEMLNAC